MNPHKYWENMHTLEGNVLAERHLHFIVADKSKWENVLYTFIFRILCNDHLYERSF